MRRLQIATAVEGMVRIERQLGEIDVLAGDLDGVDRRVAGRHLDDRLRIGEPLEILVVEFCLRWCRTPRSGACGCPRSWRRSRPVPGPAFLNSTAFSVLSMIAPRPVSGTGSSWISTSPMSMSRSTKRPQPVFLQVDRWRDGIHRGHRNSRQTTGFKRLLAGRSHRIPTGRASTAGRASAAAGAQVGMRGEGLVLPLRIELEDLSITNGVLYH